jgi:hypothetical protein
MDDEFRKVLETMKKAGAVLNDAGVPWALGGGLACWARGGPETEHDVDFLVKPEDAERAQQALADAGMRTKTPPEDWLLKAYDDNDVLIDLIFNPKDGPVDDERFDRSEELEVWAMGMRVSRLEDVLVEKILVLSEQEPASEASSSSPAHCVNRSTGWRCATGRASRRSGRRSSRCSTSWTSCSL